MHHGTCITHVPWFMSGSLTWGGGKNVPGIRGACALAISRHIYDYKMIYVLFGSFTAFRWFCIKLLDEMTTFEIADGNARDRLTLRGFSHCLNSYMECVYITLDVYCHFNRRIWWQERSSSQQIEWFVTKAIKYYINMILLSLSWHTSSQFLARTLRTVHEGRRYGLKRDCRLLWLRKKHHIVESTDRSNCRTKHGDCISSYVLNTTLGKITKWAIHAFNWTMDLTTRKHVWLWDRI